MSPLLVLALLAQLAAPSPLPSRPFVQSVEVSVTNLDVVVTDAKGQRVPGLTAADFEIIEDGKRREISNFFEAGAPDLPGAEPAASPAPSPAPPPAERPRTTYVVLVDNVHLQPGARSATFAALDGFLQRALGPGVQAAVATCATGGFRLRTPVTADAGSLTRLLQTIANEESGAGSIIASERNQVLAAVDAAAQVEDRIDRSGMTAPVPAPAPAPGTGGAPPQQTSAMVPSSSIVSLRAQSLRGVWPQVRAYSAARVRDLETTLTAVRVLTSRLSGLEGRKILLLVSGNLPSAPGLEVRSYYRETVVSQLSGGERYLNQEIRPDPEPTFERSALFGETAAAASAAGFSIFVFDGKSAALQGGAGDSRGSRQSLDATAFRSNDESQMRALAESTGGLAAIGAGQLDGLLVEIADDGSRYYSLGYSTDPMDPKKKWRPVEVRVKRPGLTVRWQRSTFPRNFAERLTLQAVTALFTPRRDNPLRAKLRGTPGQDGKTAFLLLKASIPYATLTLLPDGAKRRGVLLLNAATLTDADAVSDVPVQRARFAVDAAQIATSPGEEMLWETKLPIPAGARRISVALTDETARATSYFQADLPAAPPK